jgi:hypothetical protein
MNKQQKYSVGQVLYIVSGTKVSVYPVQIVEEVIHKRLDGEDTTYIYKMPDDNNTLKLSDIDGEIFITHADAKNTMLKRAENVINTLVDKAVNAGSVFKGSNIVSAAEVINEKTAINNSLKQSRRELKESTDRSLVQMPDGTLAKVNFKA